jgi:hypothetical protein
MVPATISSALKHGDIRALAKKIKTNHELPSSLEDREQ